MIETRTVDVMRVEADGRPARLAVHLAGAVPLAVLVHGFPLDHRMWLDVMHGPLAQRRTLCAVDLRGHGASPSCGDEVHTMELLADDVAAVVRALGDGPADICGLSMGGYVAFALHARHTELVHSLVLTNTRAAADTDEQRKGRDAAIETVANEGRAAIASAMLPKLVADGPLADDPDSREDNRARAAAAHRAAFRRASLRTMIEAQPAETIVADLRGLQQRPDRTPELAGIEVPTLVIAGDADTITPRDEAERFAAAIPGARFEVVPGTAHMSPLEDPATWSEKVASFWR